MTHDQLVTIQQIYLDIVQAGVLEDRTEYTVEDLVKSNPDLNPDQVTALYGMINCPIGPFQPDSDGRSGYDGIEVNEVLNIPPANLHDLIEGALLDTNLEGWDSYQQDVIKAFLKDLVLANRHTM